MKAPVFNLQTDCNKFHGLPKADFTGSFHDMALRLFVAVIRACLFVLGKNYRQMLDVFCNTIGNRLQNSVSGSKQQGSLCLGLSIFRCSMSQKTKFILQLILRSSNLWF